MSEHAQTQFEELMTRYPLLGEATTSVKAPTNSEQIKQMVVDLEVMYRWCMTLRITDPLMYSKYAELMRRLLWNCTPEQKDVLLNIAVCAQSMAVNTTNLTASYNLATIAYAEFERNMSATCTSKLWNVLKNGAHAQYKQALGLNNQSHNVCESLDALGAPGTAQVWLNTVLKPSQPAVHEGKPLTLEEEAAEAKEKLTCKIVNMLRHKLEEAAKTAACTSGTFYLFDQGSVRNADPVNSLPYVKQLILTDTGLAFAAFASTSTNVCTKLLTDFNIVAKYATWTTQVLPDSNKEGGYKTWHAVRFDLTYKPEPVVHSEPITDVQSEPIPCNTSAPEPEPAVQSEPITAVQSEPITAVQSEPITAVQSEPTTAVQSEPMTAVQSEPEPIQCNTSAPEPEPALQPEPITVVHSEPEAAVAASSAVHITDTAQLPSNVPLL